MTQQLIKERLYFDLQFQGFKVYNGMDGMYGHRQKAWQQIYQQEQEAECTYLNHKNRRERELEMVSDFQFQILPVAIYFLL